MSDITPKAEEPASTPDTPQRYVGSQSYEPRKLYEQMLNSGDTWEQIILAANTQLDFFRQQSTDLFEQLPKLAVERMTTEQLALWKSYRLSRANADLWLNILNFAKAKTPARK